MSTAANVVQLFQPTPGQVAAVRAVSLTMGREDAIEECIRASGLALDAANHHLEWAEERGYLYGAGLVDGAAMPPAAQLITEAEVLRRLPTGALEQVIAGRKAGQANVEELVASTETLASRADAMRFSSGELLVAPKPFDYLVGTPEDGLLPVGMTSGLTGAGYSGKSQLTAQLAVCMATGRDFLGFKVARCSTLIVSGEDAKEDYRKKLFSIGEGLGCDANEMRDIAQSVHVLDVSGLGLSLVEQVKFSSRFQPSATVDDILARVEEADIQGLGLVVLDTLSTLLGYEETNGPLAAFTAAATKMGRRLGAAVLTVHHTSKASAESGATGAGSARGGTAFTSNLRSCWALANVVTGKRGNLPLVRSLLGGEPPAHKLGDLRIVDPHKVKGQRRRPPFLVEAIPAPGGLGFVFERYRLPLADVSAGKAERAVKARAFRDGVAAAVKATGKGGSVSERELSKHLGVARPSLKADIELAVREGLLKREALGGARGTRLTPLWPGGKPEAPEQLDLDGEEVAP